MGRNAPESPSNTKKRRRNNAASAAAAANTAVSSSSGLSSGPGSSGPGDLAPPPPMTGYGDTVYASNPFDDMTPMGPSPVMGRGRPPSTGPQSQFMMGSAGMPVANGMTPPGSLSGMYGANAGPMGYPMTQVGGMPMPNGMPGPGGPMLPGSVQVPMAGGPGGPMMSGPGVPMTMGSMAGNMSQMMGASPAGMGPTPPSDLCGPMPMVPSGPMGPAGKLGMGGGGPGGVSPSPSVTAAMHSSRKVYPPDQPMVFNPQNPNAPPIYPCGMCHKEVHENDQAILCESGCNFWFHRMCTGLIEQAYHLLIAEVYAEWVCDRCLRNKNIPLIKFKP